MKNFLLAVLLLAPLAASADDVCESVASLAKSAAKARDKGHPLEDVLSVVTKGRDEASKAIRSTIRSVYDSRELSPDEIEESYLSKCVEDSPEQQAAPSHWRT